MIDMEGPGTVRWYYHWAGSRVCNKAGKQAIGNKPLSIVPPWPLLHSLPRVPALTSLVVECGLRVVSEINPFSKLLVVARLS